MAFRDRIRGKYAIEKKLGQGSFGEVYSCWNTDKSYNQDDLLVIKIIHIGSSLDASSSASSNKSNPQEDATREAKLLRQLNHKNIIQFHDSFIEKDSFCIVTEFCEGGDLEELVNKRKEENINLPTNIITKWTRQLTEALKYMHERPKPILHRDLKSRNVFLKNNQIKVGDLGVSRVLAESFANTFLGTPFYMSPEMIKDSKYDAKADIWSLGCIVFELIMLRRAYQCDSLMRLLWKIVEDDAPRISDDDVYDIKLWPMIHLMNKMLEKDVSKRSTAVEILDNEIFRDSRESSATSSTSVSRSRPDSGKNSQISRTSQPLEWFEETVKNLNTVKAKTFHWSASRNEDIHGLSVQPIGEEIVPEEIQEFESIIDSIESAETPSNTSDDDNSSFSSSLSDSSSEDEIIKEARLVLSDSINSKLYHDKDIRPDPKPMRNAGQNNIKIARRVPQAPNTIGNKILNSKIERLQNRCIELLGNVNFNNVHRFLQRVYKSGRSGDPVVMDELKEMVGPQLASHCMVVEELIMAEQQVKG